MSIALVQTVRNTGTNNTSTVSKSVTFTTGNALLVIVGCGSSQSVSGVSDGTNTYTAKGTPISHTGQGMKYSKFVADNVTGGTKTITATISANTAYPWIFVQEVSGQAASCWDSEGNAYFASASPTSTDGITTGNIARVAQPNLMLGLVIGAGGSSSGTGFSFGTYGSDAPSSGAGYVDSWATEYLRTTATGNKAITFSNGNSGDNVLVLGTVFSEFTSTTAKASRFYYGMRI